MNPWVALLAALVGYLLGAVSFTRMVGSYLLPGEDVGNAEIPIKGSDKKFPFRSFGATSIRAKAGAKYGCLTSVLDMMKVTLPTLAFKIVFPEGDYFLIAAAAGVAGHNFPVYYRFKGGRGMSPLYGGLLVVDWLAIPVATIVGCCIGFWLVHYAFLSYFGVMLFLVAWFGVRFGDPPHLFYALAVNIFFWLASLPDINMYLVYKRAGEFNKTTNRFSGLDSEFTLGPIIRGLRRMGWIKDEKKTDSNK